MDSSAWPPDCPPHGSRRRTGFWQPVVSDSRRGGWRTLNSRTPIFGCAPLHEFLSPESFEASPRPARVVVASAKLVVAGATTPAATAIARAPVAHALAGGVDHLCLRFGCGGFGGRLSTGNQLVLQIGLRPPFPPDARDVLRRQLRAAHRFIAHRWLAAQFVLPRSGGQRHTATQTRVLERFRLRAVAGGVGKIRGGHSQHRRRIESRTRRAKRAAGGRALVESGRAGRGSQTKPPRTGGGGRSGGTGGSLQHSARSNHFCAGGNHWRLEQPFSRRGVAGL